MPYSLPLTFNNRREIFAELQLEGNTMHQIVLALPDTYAVNLVSIDKQQLLRSLHEQGFDISLRTLQFEVALAHKKILITLKHDTEQANDAKPADTSFKDDYYAELDEAKLLKLKKEQEQQKATQVVQTESNIELGAIGTHIKCTAIDTNLKFSINCQALQIADIAQFDEAQISVEFCYVNNQQTYTARAQVFFAHPKQYMAMALDFGSESSQLAVQHFDTKYGVRPMQPSIDNLFENVKNYHINNTWTEDDNTATYYQEERDNNFYKSIFFLRERLTGSYSDLETEAYIKDQPNNLKMLVKIGALTELVENKHYQLPNLKISHKHADLLKRYKIKVELSGSLYTSTLNDMQSLVSSNILHTLLASTLHKDKLRYQHNSRMVRLMLLVPNIYDAEHVHKVQKQLDAILRDLAETDYKNRLLAWEVLTISESDAAFIGFLNKADVAVKKGKDYAVIDVGKGTTDFSILRTGENNILDLQSIYRNGFAGAGNLITHAIFETVLHFIREQNNIGGGALAYLRENILAVLDGSNLGARNLFFEQIERLKFNFSTNPIAAKAQWLKASSGDYRWYNLIDKHVDTTTDFNAITNLLKQVEQGADFYGYVQDVCETISTKVVEHLAMVKKHKTDFACEGVLLTGRGFLFKPLQQLVIQKIINELDIPENKISILTGNELKDICIKGVFDNSVRINAESVGHPIQIIRIDDTRTAHVSSLINETASPSNWFQKLMLRAMHKEAQNYKHKFIENNNLSFADLSNSHIVIGSNTYKVANGQIFDVQPNTQYKATIDYTNTGYIVRRHSNGTIDCISKLEQVIDYSNADKLMVIPSLFPNYVVEDNIQSMNASITPQAHATPTDTPAQTMQTPITETPPAPETPINDLLF